MLSCNIVSEVTFSKIVLIFLYYVLIKRLIKRTEAACSRKQYIIYGIMLFYSLVNMLVIVQNFRDGQKSYLSAVNMGCIVLADLYLLYYVKMADEKRYYENRVKALEQQAKMQYEYYLAQTEKYSQTVRILHDVDKHIRAIENLYGTEREHTGWRICRGNQKYTGTTDSYILHRESDIEHFADR